MNPAAFYPTSTDVLRFLPELILTIGGVVLLVLEASAHFSLLLRFRVFCVSHVTAFHLAALCALPKRRSHAKGCGQWVWVILECNEEV